MPVYNLAKRFIEWCRKMMNVEIANFLLMFVGLGLLFAQALVKQKRAEHVLFGIFCASIVMVCAEQLSAPVIGSYSYLVGLLTCGTCNVIWLLSRALFRGNSNTNDSEPAFSKRHIIFALSIAVLVMINKGLLFTNAMSYSDESELHWFKAPLIEVMTLLSSTVLVLSFWEALRGYSHQSKAQKMHRIVFSSVFFLGVFLCMVVVEGAFTDQQAEQIFPWLRAVSALSIMIVIQFILSALHRARLDSTNGTDKVLDSTHTDTESAVDLVVVSGIEDLIFEKQMYLQADVKMKDFAQALCVPEYKVSRAIRLHFGAPNFNHYINRYRIEHAIKLMSSAHSSSWAHLVIALESGFSSVNTFNRVFKTTQGCIPSEFKKNLAELACT